MQHIFGFLRIKRAALRAISTSIFAIFMLSPTVAYALLEIPDRISFQNLLANKDISMGEGRVVFQDSDGFIWLGGSNALIRYDGYDFKKMYLVVAGEKGSERVDIKFVQDIYQDSRGVVWVAGIGGIYRYDAGKDKLTSLKDNLDQALQISTVNIWRITEIHTGEMVASTLKGLIIIDPNTNDYTSIVPDGTKANWLTKERVNVTYGDPNSGDVWVGTEAGLEKVNWETKTFQLILPHPEAPDLASAQWVNDIVPDDQGRLWVATSNGLVNFDPETQATKRYVNDPSDRFSLSGNDIWKLQMGADGALWIASDGGGVSVFDKTSGRFINHKNEPGRAGSLSSNQVRTVYEDRSGDIWAGTYPVGINFFDRSSAAITSYARESSNPNSLSHSSVLSVQEDKAGNLWLGTDGGGLNYFNRDLGEFTHFQHDPNDPVTISSNAVLCVYIDSKGLIWTGHWGGGMSSYDPREKKFTRYPFDDQRAVTTSVSTSKKLNSAHVWSIKEDKNGDMWIGTHNGGLSKYDRNSKIFTHYTMGGQNPEQEIASALVWSTFEDSNGQFWLATPSGLDLMDREKGTFTHYAEDPENPKSISNSNVLSVYEDSKNRLWVGTDAGLNLFDASTTSFTAYTKEDGFNDDTIRTILEDAEGKLWLSTNNGVSSFDPETKNIKNYNRESGRLVGGFNTESGVVSQKGEIVFGGVNGLRFYKPEKLTENTNIPPVVFTDFKIFADSVKVDGPEGILTKSINQTEVIELDYTKSMFVFNFSALNYRDPGKNQYAYKLEGFDEDWLYIGNQRQAKYTNLNAGKYVFRVKGSNNDGVWNEEGKSITVVQYPPPWKTWWAYTLYTLAVIGLLAWFVHAQRKKRKLVEEQNRILEQKVAERTAELRQKNNDIQAMLSNMPQGLFTVQEGGAIHPEYSAFLESIFETENIAERDAGELLFTGAKIGSDALNSAKEAMFAIIGEDEMNFDFNASLLVEEYSIDIGDTTKVLALDWNPIVEEDIVNKLMVSVRDVTILRQMESEAEEQKRQLDIISQLLNLPADKYLGFEESSAKYVQANREAVESTDKRDQDVIALLFRNMHTIKGNCRTFGFTHLSNVVHEVESTYSAMKASLEGDWDKAQLLSELDEVETALAEYAHVYRKVLGRGEDSGRRQDGFWMNSSAMQQIHEFVDTSQMAKLKVFLEKLQSKTVQQALVDIISSLSSIANQLDKEAPDVTVEAEGVAIKSAGYALMSDVFAHVLRNSVDHGLELPEERLGLGKPEQGKIDIHASVNDAMLDISVKDDGRGINLDALFKKGVELGRWQDGDSPSREDIAELIFASGVSTKEAVTSISGRGVGMDAVKQFLVEKGGKVTIKLDEGGDQTSSFAPFALVVSLPGDLFFVVEEA